MPARKADPLAGKAVLVPRDVWPHEPPPKNGKGTIGKRHNYYSHIVKFPNDDQVYFFDDEQLQQWVVPEKPATAGGSGRPKKAAAPAPPPPPAPASSGSKRRAEPEAAAAAASKRGRGASRGQQTREQRIEALVSILDRMRSDVLDEAEAAVERVAAKHGL